MPELIERRSGRFTERLSMTVILVAALGGYLVLLDPTLEGQVLGFHWKLGTGDFSAELKGAVVTIMLIGGWTAVVSFWIGASKGDEQKSAALSRIAEAAPNVAAAAVAASAGPVKADEVIVEATGAVNVNHKEPDK